ncbi:hypothetical protein [Flavobacterium reichenbachii]|uniref:Uncharacterized protein n=1 Tax=Flavobacterium reichenbachii TaxID=362418 RepID=A0A085ZK79_9FLAO|nr:hypothetical protein [Flavobacterium reichenbachii]KFF04843.1 hypothetical protein IW19_04545 [Flavobacterium reichenbachii]OXB12170.1 hypothetical protein B0A68_19615 [Flavobacterium reichenbachii]
MYKHKNKTRLEQSKQPLLYWVKRKLLLIITAFMLGMSNGMNAEDRSVNGNFIQTEQQDKKD